jgi:hypothetical protein
MSGSADDEFLTIEDLYKRIETLESEIAAMPRDDPRRHKIVSELTRLNFLAEWMRRAKP